MRQAKDIFNKINIFLVGSTLITLIIIGRLFHLQIISHARYQQIATSSQYGFIELPAQRGDIIIRDQHSREEFPLATNTTLNLLFADPTIVKDPLAIADKLTPLIFSIEEERASDNERIEKTSRKLAPDLTEEEKNAILKPLTDDELKEKFRQDFITKISQKQRPEVILAIDFTSEKIEQVKNAGVPGVEVKDNDIYAYPSRISGIGNAAQILAPIIEIPVKKLEKILKGENRYVILKRKLEPSLSKKVEKIFSENKKMFEGIGMKEEYFRFYPESTLAANIIGYVNHENIGQYGIESSFNTRLQGITGKLQTKKDSVGRQITVGESQLQAAVDGDDIVLTIDRSIQSQMDKILEEAAKHYQADSGQAIIINPQTGAILAMSHYPSFDPNRYGDVFKKVEVKLTTEEIKNLYPTKDNGIYYFYTNEVTLDYYLIFEQKDENGIIRYFRYENFRGPEVYHNKIVSWPYEPGSVFKPVVMSMAIDDGDVTPNTTFNDSGPIGVDWNIYKKVFDFEIKNSEGRYYGPNTTMKDVIAKSLNTGMTFVSKKIGPSLFYNYLKKFGFLDRTDIEFDNETIGKIEYFEDWTESELATHAFGQGLTVSMVQLANAFSTIANGGLLMKPHIVEEIRHDNGNITRTDPQQIRRVLSEDTAAKMTAMLTYSSENGVAQSAKVKGHFIAGKTGTAQTYKNGKALSGIGTTIASFVGYGPINNPQFVVVIKFDHPKLSEWGNTTAAPTFTKIAEFLFDYYNIPPDK
ncbi:penicillin-binding protein 2 [Candidatus Peregrinibacteria bacterium]|nr:penicillin-binding protein 2 [Candidatus Peregrinibacteria bacterium]